MARGQETRNRLDATALKLFAAKGVEQTTTRDIAEGAGVAEGTLYRHYLGKDDLVWQLFSRRYQALAKDLDALQSGERGIAAKIGAMVGRFCGLYDQDPETFRFLFLVQHGQLSKLPDRMPTPVTVVERVVAEAIERGELTPQDPALATAIVFGIVTQPAVFKIYGRVPAPMSDLAPRLTRACLGALAT
jgi:AcrR family transcriptional regulator